MEIVLIVVIVLFFVGVFLLLKYVTVQEQIVESSFYNKELLQKELEYFKKWEIILNNIENNSIVVKKISNYQKLISKSF